MLSLLTHSKPQDRGEVSEWFKEAVLKTVEQQCSVGSNPTFSAIFFFNENGVRKIRNSILTFIWRSTQEAEGARLESE